MFNFKDFEYMFKNKENNAENSLICLVYELNVMIYEISKR